MPKPKTEPFSIVNQNGTSAYVLSCEHASFYIPEHLSQLGLDPKIIRRHIGWDIGAANVTNELSSSLDAISVHSNVSRLVIDCNRHPDHPTSIPEISDNTVIPGNMDISKDDRADRLKNYFQPYHDALRQTLNGALHRHPNRAPALVSIHSFTPSMGGFNRPWHIGILWDRDQRLAQLLVSTLGTNTDLVIGENEPYSGHDMAGHSIRYHAQNRGIPNVLIEVRQDLISTPKGVKTWAKQLHDALEEAARHPDLLTMDPP